MAYCTNCGAEAGQNDKFCQTCGTELGGGSDSETPAADGFGHEAPTPDATPAHSRSITTADELDTADLPRRVGAVFVDTLFAWVVMLLFLDILGYGFVAFLVSYVFVYPSYFAVAEGWTGRTPGKALFGLRVVSLSGQPLDTEQAVIRNIIRLVDGLFYYLVGFVSILGSERNQRLGDVAAKTLVVRDP